MEIIKPKLSMNRLANYFESLVQRLVLFTLILFIMPEELLAQSSLKINDLGEVKSKIKEGADTVSDSGKGILASVLVVCLVFTIYNLASNNPHGKEYALCWFVAVIFVLVALLIV